MAIVIIERENGSLRVSHDFSEEESVTVQSFRDECDINRIMRKWLKTGLIEHVNRFHGNYGDFTGVMDYQSSLEFIRKADEMFMTVPSDIRSRFNNDPASFLEFVSDPANKAQMLELGLLRPSAVPQGVSEVSNEVQSES